jgi:hypothetical protein
MILRLPQQETPLDSRKFRLLAYILVLPLLRVITRGIVNVCHHNDVTHAMNAPGDLMRIFYMNWRAV